MPDRRGSLVNYTFSDLDNSPNMYSTVIFDQSGTRLRELPLNPGDAFLESDPSGLTGTNSLNELTLNTFENMDARIVGGVESDITDYPFYASIGNKASCGYGLNYFQPIFSSFFHNI